MSLAKFRKIYGKSGSGRFVVSEGIAPSAALTAHPGLPTLWEDFDDDRNEIVMVKGTILTVIADANGDSRLVPCGGAAGRSWQDSDVVDLNATPVGYTAGATGDEAVVPAASVPIGCAQFNIVRPWDKGTDIYGSWITHGYVEWPMVEGLNDDVTVGGVVISDVMGRPIAGAGTEGVQVVGKVIEIERFATNFDDGLLSYMQLPSDPGALKSVYSLSSVGDYTGKMGIRKNLDVSGSLGAIRVNLTL